MMKVADSSEITLRLEELISRLLNNFAFYMNDFFYPPNMSCLKRNMMQNITSTVIFVLVKTLIPDP